LAVVQKGTNALHLIIFKLPVSINQVKRMFSIILVGVLFVSGCSKTKYEPEKYSADLVKRAEAGNAPAQFSLGLCYQEGEGVAQDGVEAFEWFSKAANQGHSEAGLMLGECYILGGVVPKDETCEISPTDTDGSRSLTTERSWML
jgi:TPR repeat protein